MDTRHLVDPQVWPIIDLLPSFVFDRATLDQTRADSAGRFADLLEIPLAPTIHTARRADGSPIELYRFDPNPGTTGRAALFHIHGGGMILGSARDMQFGPSSLAAALGIPVVSVSNTGLPPKPPSPGRSRIASTGSPGLRSTRANWGSTRRGSRSSARARAAGWPQRPR